MIADDPCTMMRLIPVFETQILSFFHSLIIVVTKEIFLSSSLDGVPSNMQHSIATGMLTQ